MKTIQEAFNVAATHLLKQGRRSNLPEITGLATTCAYRAENGDRCAIGALISDEHYNQRLESKWYGHELVLEALEDSGWPMDTDAQNVYMGLQDIHDDSAVNEWSSLLEALADEYHLTYPGALVLED